jgi:hypothetical protein
MIQKPVPVHFAELTPKRASKMFGWSEDLENNTLLTSFLVLGIRRNRRVINLVNTVDDLAHRPYFLPKIDEQ